MATSIDPTAVISSSAQLGNDVTVGPYCIIGDNVAIDDNVRLHSHVVIDGHTTIGDGCEIFPFAVLGARPQHTREHRARQGAHARRGFGSQAANHPHVCQLGAP